MLGGRFLTQYYRVVAEWAEWAEWATAIVQDWPDDPRQAVPPNAAMYEIARRADWCVTGAGARSPALPALHLAVSRVTGTRAGQRLLTDEGSQRM